MSVDGTDKLCRQLDRMSEAKGLYDSVAAAGKFVQANAKLNAGHFTDTGNLRERIFTKQENLENISRSTIYTNEEYGPYVELGTGPKGNENHKGISPHVAPVYTMSPWWIHESQIDKRVAEKYKWFYIDTKDGRFYQCTGQPAKPFMYPAIANNREIIKKMIQTGIMKGIKESL